MRIFLTYNLLPNISSHSIDLYYTTILDLNKIEHRGGEPLAWLREMFPWGMNTICDTYAWRWFWVNP